MTYMTWSTMTYMTWSTMYTNSSYPEEEEEEEEEEQQQFTNFKDRGFALAVKNHVFSEYNTCFPMN